ncbi:hypothetical protein KJ855_03225 [Patescibacteria group bacterium]|nr:hypothetical protein [Patescibacteria group bacterium]
MKRTFIVILTALLIFPGCQEFTKNQNIAAIDLQISRIQHHVESISTADNIYYNENVDFTLLNEAKQVCFDNGIKLTEEYSQETITPSELSSGLDKMISLLYFIWMEEFDTATRDQNHDQLVKIKQEHDSIGQNEVISNWLTENNLTQNYQQIQDIIKNTIDAVDKGKTIEANDTKLSSLQSQLEQFKQDNQIDSYNNLVNEYNSLLEQNKALINEYNLIITEYDSDYIFNSFLSLVNIKLLFPQQENLQLK